MEKDLSTQCNSLISTRTVNGVNPPMSSIQTSLWGALNFYQAIENIILYNHSMITLLQEKDACTTKLCIRARFCKKRNTAFVSSSKRWGGGSIDIVFPCQSFFLFIQLKFHVGEKSTFHYNITFWDLNTRLLLVVLWSSLRLPHLTV